MAFEKTSYLMANACVVPYVVLVAQPALHCGDFAAVGQNDSDRYLAGAHIIRTIERRSGGGITAKTSPCFLLKQ